MSSAYRHPGDTEFGGSFFGRHLPALGPLAGPIDGNATPIAECIDPIASPRVPFGRPPTHTVEKGGNGLVGKETGKRRDELCRVLIGLPACSPGAASPHIERRVFATLPMDHALELVVLGLDDDLLDHRSQDFAS